MKIDFEEGQLDSETWYERITVTFTRDEMLARRNIYGVFDKPRVMQQAFARQETIRSLTGKVLDNETDTTTPDADLDPETLKRAREMYGLPGA